MGDGPVTVPRRISRPRLPVATDGRAAVLGIATRANHVWVWLRRRTRLLVMLTLGLAATCLIVAGIAMIFLPAGLIAAGLALVGFLTFDPASARKLTWPR